MAKQYVVTIDIDQAVTDDPAGLTQRVIDALTTCAEGIDGVSSARVVGVA